MTSTRAPLRGIDVNKPLPAIKLTASTKCATQPLPTLPKEIVRDIMERAIKSSLHTCTVLARVSKEIQSWVEAMFYHTIDLRPHIMQGTIMQLSSSTPASYRLSSSRVESFARTLLIASEARRTCLRDNVRNLILPHGCGVQLDAFEYCSDVVRLQTELYKGGRAEVVPQGYYGDMSPKMWACTLHPHFLPAKPVWKPKKRSFESPLMYLYLLVDRYPGINYSIRKLDITIPQVSRAVMISGNIIRALLFECNEDEAIAWVKDTLLAQNPKALIIDQVFKFCDAFLFVEKMQDPRIVLTNRNHSNAIATKTNIPFEEYIKFAKVQQNILKRKNGSLRYMGLVQGDGVEAAKF